MKTVRTARGKTIDMSALAAKHENERAVSNVPVNARGDIIDSRGEIKVKREDVSREFYKNNVPGADEKQVPIKEEIVDTGSKKKKEEPALVEISRVERERKDGSIYYEVEYSDGSMEEIDA